MRKKIQIVLLTLVIFASSVPSASAQESPQWHRRARLQGAYDLGGRRILIVAAQAFNYGETVAMAECWKQWGAQVEFAGPARTLTGERESATPADPPPPTPPTLHVDHLLSEADPARYDVLYVAGGEGIAELLSSHRDSLARLMDGVDDRGRVVAAICHGPLALAASTMVKGRRLTVQGPPDARRMLEQAGAVLLNEVVVVDGSLVTGQWPHLEEFAATLAERVQFPRGGGPREKALSSRTPIERAVDDMRNTYGFDDRQLVPADALERLARASQRALTPRGGYGPDSMRFVVVRQGSIKGELARILSEKAKSSLVAMGMAEGMVHAQVRRMIEGSPILLFQFVRMPTGLARAAREPVLRSEIAFAGSAAAHLSLVARDLGLGVSLLGLPAFIAAEEEIRQVLGVPGTERLAGILGIGYPALGATGTPVPAKPAAEIFFSERWGAALGPRY